MVEKQETIYQVTSLPNEIDPSLVLNINIGVLGHVDSGKTSLSKRLSTVASTASFDKNPQSKERGITLDLGFSAFYIKIPASLKEKYKSNERLQQSEYFQLTLVDCPGHASLIRTVVAGAAIIDVIVLVIDCIKGIQIQTTECLVLSEILAQNMIVALNKVDIIATNVDNNYDNFKQEVENKITYLRNAFSKTKFKDDIIICPVTADTSKLFILK